MKKIYNNPEIDEPLDEEKSDCSQKAALMHLKDKDVGNYEEKLEKQAKLIEKFDKHIYKKYGLELLVGCLVIYLLIVVADTIVANALSWKASELSGGFVELLKFIVSTLIGYVFSEIQKSNKD